VLWSGDYTPIPAASVSEMQQRCRGLFQRAQVRRYCRWSHSEPHKLVAAVAEDSGGTGFWHETYFMGGGIEAIYDDMNRPTGLARFAPGASARRNVGGAAQGRAHRALDGRARDHRGGVLPRLASRPAALHL
jgi:hypothetical protein